jgi:hypothetical protein
LRSVGQERVHFLGLRRQSGQIVTGASDQRAPVGLARWLNAFLLEPGQDESINPVVRGFGVLDDRRSGFLQRLECPEVPLFRGHRKLVRARGLCSLRLRPRGAEFHPLRDSVDLLGLQLPTFGHLQVALMPQRFQQKTAVGIARHNRRTAVPAFQHVFAGVEPESGDARLRVAGVALGGQQGAHLRLEQIQPIGAA